MISTNYTIESRSIDEYYLFPFFYWILDSSVGGRGRTRGQKGETDLNGRINARSLAGFFLLFFSFIPSRHEPSFNPLSLDVPFPSLYLSSGPPR